jgi:transcription antitermination protein NusB
MDSILTGHLAENWSVARLDPVLRALLRSAAFELSSAMEPPARVVINEYMDIAHGFFGGEEPRFANGVLDAMARTLRAAEFNRQG